MISKKKQDKYLITSILFNDKEDASKSFEVLDLRKNNIIRCTLHEIKDEKQYKKKRKEIRDYTESLNYPCYEPLTIRIDINDKIYMGSVCMPDYSTNLEYLEDKYEESLKK